MRTTVHQHQLYMIVLGQGEEAHRGFGADCAEGGMSAGFSCLVSALVRLCVLGSGKNRQHHMEESCINMQTEEDPEVQEHIFRSHQTKLKHKA